LSHFSHHPLIDAIITFIYQDDSKPGVEGIKPCTGRNKTQSILPWLFGLI